MDFAEYIMFSFWFIVIHTGAYTIAGMIALKISGNLYEEKNRVMDYLRNMSDEKESKHVNKYFIPAQLIRGLLLSVVLYPILGLLGEITFPLRFAFLSGLMFIYTDFASAIPFSNNIEGFVYMKKRYLKMDSFWKLYLETIMYSLIFGFLAAWYLF
ncbi:MAG: hypothetical protein IAX21_08105 [Candidatus Bathyarchaeota archaeon]|nr:hypothetical protein [Candidatus Bathyarchaeum tardum]WGM89149.1 MAG: hypothetical protein NUK63_09575 [Candidatus Bathyarchaeum tardum]WNZ28613.1 MAG: hypothetical protein IAX21_08105 [Candidatus Bathyarchaeota archaeon]